MKSEQVGSTDTDPDCIVHYTRKEIDLISEGNLMLHVGIRAVLLCFYVFSSCQNRVRVDSSLAWSVCQFVLTRLPNTRRVVRRKVPHLISSYHRFSRFANESAPWTISFFSCQYRDNSSCRQWIMAWDLSVDFPHEQPVHIGFVYPQIFHVHQSASASREFISLLDFLLLLPSSTRS